MRRMRIIQLSGDRVGQSLSLIIEVVGAGSSSCQSVRSPGAQVKEGRAARFFRGRRAWPAAGRAVRGAALKMGYFADGLSAGMEWKG